MTQAREDRRIGDFPFMQGRPIYTFWDIGLNDETAVTFKQNVGNAWIVGKYLEGTDDGLIEWVRRVRELAVDNRWNIVKWVGPHDLKKRGAASGETTWDEVKLATGIAFDVVPRVAAKKVSIDKLRGLFSLLRFDETGCEQLIPHLDLYRWDYDEIRAVYRDKPYHGPESNAADAMQQWALWVADGQKQAELLAMGREERPRRRQNHPDGQARPEGRHRGMAGWT